MPERSCNTCKHYRPYEGSVRLKDEFGKCASPRKPTSLQFADTARGIPDLCGPDARWWERKRPIFEIVEDEPRTLQEDYDEDDL